MRKCEMMNERVNKFYQFKAYDEQVEDVKDMTK